MKDYIIKEGGPLPPPVEEDSFFNIEQPLQRGPSTTSRGETILHQGSSEIGVLSIQANTNASSNGFSNISTMDPQSHEPKQQSRVIKSLEELLSMLKSDGKVVINGESFEVDLKSSPIPRLQGSGSIETNSQSNLSSALHIQEQLPLATTLTRSIETITPICPQQAKVTFTGINFAAINQLVDCDEETKFDETSQFDFPTFDFQAMMLPQQPLQQLPCQTPKIFHQAIQNENPNIPQKVSKQSDQIGSNTPDDDGMMLKRHKSEMPVYAINRKFIISDKNTSNKSDSIIGIKKENDELRTLTLRQSDEIQQLRKQQKELIDVVVKHFTQKSITSSIQNQDVLEILSQAQIQNAKLHLAFLFASPLVKIIDDNEDKPKPMDSIDHVKEFNGVLESLEKTGMEINYSKVQATHTKITDTLTQNPVALHFSGHGLRKQIAKKCDSNPLKPKGSVGYLVIEDESAQAIWMEDNYLTKMLKEQGTQPEFVFVASCHSQFAGDIFHKAGAKHVICVKENYQISDEASIIFSKTFYTALFSQCKTVCEAFQIARSHLESHANEDLRSESVKFMLLKNNDGSDDEYDPRKDKDVDPTFIGFKSKPKKKKKHQCRIFGPFKPGKVNNVGHSPMFRVETCKVEDFIGRTTEMHQVIGQIINRRIVNILGIPGIGKTTLCKAVAHYLDERQQFRDGIIILSLRGLDQARMILTRLELIISKKLKDQQQPVADEQKALENIVKFLQDKEVLLILDNAETPSKNDPVNFQKIIQTLLDECQHVKLLFTSRYNIGTIANHVEQAIELKELQMKFAVELLKKKSPRKITNQEIEELLKIKPDKVLHSNPLKKQSVKGELESHHMFEILKGHPHAISLAAPLLQDKKLKELYELLNSDEMNDWLAKHGIKDDPMGSLKVSMDISMKQLQETEPQAINLFWLIGLMPGGCTAQDLNCLWGEDWMSLAEKLLRSSLLVKKNISDENVYQLFPFMNQYAASNMDQEEKLETHHKITNYLTKVCIELLKAQISMDQRVNRLLTIETNIWACIYRMRDMNIDPDHLKATRSRSPGHSFHADYPPRGTTPLSLNKSSALSNTNPSEQEGSGSGQQTAPHCLSDRQHGAITTDDGEDSSDEPNTFGDNISTDHDYNGGDMYDSILSKRMNYGQKIRSKSEKIKKNMRGEGDDIIEEEKEEKPIITVSPDTSEEGMQEEEMKASNSDERTISYSQPQSAISSRDLLASKLEDELNGQTQSSPHYQNHLTNRTFNESMISGPPMILTRNSSIEGQQIFENLMQNQPSNQQSQLNNSFSGALQNDQQQFGSILRPLQGLNQRNLNQSFMVEVQQQPVNALQRFEDQSFQSSRYTHGGYQNNQLFENFETDSYESLQAYIQPLNVSQRDIQMPSFMNTSYQPAEQNYFPNLSQASIIQKRHVGRNIEEKIPEEILEESISCADDDLELQPGMMSKSYSNLRSCERIDEEHNEHGDDEEHKMLNIGQIHLEDQQETINSAAQSDDSSESVSDDEYLNTAEQMQRQAQEMIQEQINSNELQSELNDHNLYQTAAPPQLEGQKKEGKSTSSLKKINKGNHNASRRVTIQENPETFKTKDIQTEDHTDSEHKVGSSKQKHVNAKTHIENYKPLTRQTVMMSQDGTLLVYYATNLIVLGKYEDALKVIEQFGMKLVSDVMCQANLKKLQAYAMHHQQKQPNFKDVKSKYMEALSMFQDLNNFLGVALCNFALGFLFYSHSQHFTTKVQKDDHVFKMAKEKLEESIKHYNKLKHMAGESECHRYLMFIKKKNKENYSEHDRSQKEILKSMTKLSEEGRLNFLMINGMQGGIQASVFLEIVAPYSTKLDWFMNQQRLQNEQPFIMSSRPHYHSRATVKETSKSQKRQNKANQIQMGAPSPQLIKPIKVEEPQMTNIQNVNRKSLLVKESKSSMQQDQVQMKNMAESVKSASTYKKVQSQIKPPTIFSSKKEEEFSAKKQVKGGKGRLEIEDFNGEEEVKQLKKVDSTATILNTDSSLSQKQTKKQIAKLQQHVSNISERGKNAQANSKPNGEKSSKQKYAFMSTFNPSANPEQIQQPSSGTAQQQPVFEKRRPSILPPPQFNSTQMSAPPKKKLCATQSDPQRDLPSARLLSDQKQSQYEHQSKEEEKQSHEPLISVENTEQQDSSDTNMFERDSDFNLTDHESIPNSHELNLNSNSDHTHSQMQYHNNQPAVILSSSQKGSKLANELAVQHEPRPTSALSQPYKNFKTKLKKQSSSQLLEQPVTRGSIPSDNQKPLSSKIGSKSQTSLAQDSNAKVSSRPQTPSMQQCIQQNLSQFVSFNVTATTTIKFEGHIPQQLMIGPALTIGPGGFTLKQQDATAEQHQQAE